jgi:hypothetical protein
MRIGLLKNQLTPRSAKSRRMGRLRTAVPRRRRRSIPDFALDKHTAAGKRLGRGAEHFFAEGIKPENETGGDAYRELARQTLAACPATESNAEAEPRLF